MPLELLTTNSSTYLIMATNTPICATTDCSNFCVDLDDKICHKCYHNSADECWCGEKDYKDYEAKSCSHKFECGCGKQSCLEMGLDKCDEDFCDNESCKHYYNHRNDNCDCGRCGYCDSDLDE